MVTPTRKNAWKPWHGFAIEIGPDTDLCTDGLLIYELATGSYIPVGAVSTANEAQEIAASCELAKQAPGQFRLWARGLEGRFLVVPIAINVERS